MAAPIDVMGRKENWTRFNHLHVEGMQTPEGYAYCENCAVIENTADAGMPCLKGPVVKFHEAELHREIDRENREDERDEMTTVGDTLAHSIEESGSAIAFGLTEIAAAMRQKQ